MANFGFTITVEGKEKLQEIEKIVNKIGEKQNIKLNIDTSFSNKISDIENKLKNIEETIKNSNSIKFTPISKDTESQINNANNRINELGRTIKTVSKYGQTGDIKEQIQTINTELGKTVQIINHYKNGIFSGTNENHITNYDKIARKLRYNLKDNKACLEIPVVYSEEQMEKTGTTIGSNAYIPSIFGLMMASFIINDVRKEEK